MSNSKKMEACLVCVIACERCITDCILDSKRDCIAICRDCVDICSIAARFSARDSVYSKELFALCVKVCKACAEECRKHEVHHESCRECADACIKCAELCV